MVSASMSLSILITSFQPPSRLAIVLQASCGGESWRSVVIIGGERMETGVVDFVSQNREEGGRRRISATVQLTATPRSTATLTVQYINSP